MRYKEQIMIRLSSLQKKKIERIAKREKMTVGEMIREFIDKNK